VLCGTFSILTTVAIIGVLATETVRFFHLPDVSISEFLFGLEWNPLLGAQKHFGIWPLICGTLLVTGVAMLFALPFGLITAIYLSEYAPRRLRGVIKPVLEILAGIPTVVYGFFALTVITPGLQWLNDGFEIYNVCSAGIAVGIMCLPIVCSLSEDALRAVPRSLREGAYGVGATKFDVSVKVVVPSALSGIVAAFLLAIARAVGETMIVALAAGNMARLTLDPRESAQTMTAYMVQIFLGDASNFGPEYLSSYAVAATLFVMTLGLTLLGHQIRVRFREAYQ
jgi:phosphate transport system permease protein